MLTVLKTAEPDQLPVFVAYNLEKLPPVCFDHIDLTKLLKDLVSLREEIKQIKVSYVTKEDLENKQKKDINSVNSPVSYINSNINIRRGGYLLDSGPFGLSHVSESSPPAPPCETSAEPLPPIPPSCPRATTMETGIDDSVPDANISLQYRSLCNSNGVSHDSVAVAPVNSTLLSRNVTNINDFSSKQLTMAEIVSKGEMEMERVGQWTVVQNKKLKNRFTGRIGKAQSAAMGNFKAAESFIPHFVSNVHKHTSEADICDYIKTKTLVTVKLEKINIKTERTYNAFKIFVSKNKLDTFLDDIFAFCLKEYALGDLCF